MKAGSVFVTVLLAITVAVFLFAPERLPSGIGITPIPLEASVRPSLFGQGQVAILENQTGKTLHNVNILLLRANGEIVKGGMRENWPPGDHMELGWLEGWQIEQGSRLEVKASGYYSRTWQY